jgi:dipeptidyl aminopeptidase/acylaminoacyl peptidase
MPWLKLPWLKRVETTRSHNSRIVINRKFSSNTNVLAAIALSALTTSAPAQNTSEQNQEPLNITVQAEYGSWESPLTAASIFEDSDSISSLTVANNQLYFIERRASANGRNILAQLDENHSALQLTPSDMSVRSRVHEYGGRPYLVGESDIYFSNFNDQLIYTLSSDAEPQALTTDGLRYMECVNNQRHRQLICVREDHRKPGEPINTLVAIDTVNAGEGEILFEGTDFVTSPTISSDGASVAFITWSHPNMPWDDTQLRVTRLAEDGSALETIEVPQSGNVSISNPAYSHDNTLYFLADFENWRTLYRLNAKGVPELVIDQKIELTSYGFESESSAVISYLIGGVAHLARVNLTNGDLDNINGVFSFAGSIAHSQHGTYFIASTPDSQSAIYLLEGDEFQKVYQPSGAKIASEFLSTPQYLTFPTGQQEEAYGFYYPPKNASYSGPDSTLPPLIVKVHGGPVSASYSTLDPSIQFWTSRGFAVFDVNHRGSTGYGRAFRKKLYPNWGIVDIEDAASGVEWLAANKFIDDSKVAIRGGSAGGYTVLAAMAFEDVFSAGTSYFGISDLEVLYKGGTHKYESRYLDQLIGAYPEARDVYLARSPIHHVDKIRSPLLLLQGMDDEVVPPVQSELIFQALVKNCIPTAYLPFEGEGHGFRQPANNIKALNSELDFYGQVFKFTPFGNLEPVLLERCG